jgi:membrane-associated phospholipid phosphatase
VLKNWLSNPVRRRTVLLVIAAAVVAFAALFLKLADSVRESEFVVRIDQNALEFVAHHRVGWLSQAARVITVLGSGWIVAVVIVGAATALMLRHRRLDALFVVASSTGSAVAVAMVKHTVGRPRPALSDRLVTATGAAFPSGHAAQSIACYGALAVIMVAASRSNRTRAFAIAGAVVIALAVGASRVYLGVHWTSDVVSGWLLAAGWLLTLIGVRTALESTRPNPR